jgi:transposase
MNSVGIDVSKGKSMVAALRPMGEVALLPREMSHSAESLAKLVDIVHGLGDNTRVVMEATGRYHEPIASALHDAGIFVSVVNPVVIHGFGNNSVRRVKTDRKDAMKIAKFGLDNWSELREYDSVDVTRQQLKLFSRQYNLCMKTVVSLQNNLISLLDKTFPGVNALFSSPPRDDGRQKWVDFASAFYHRDCVKSLSLKAFTEKYRKWCKRNGYLCQVGKAEEIYVFSTDLYTTLPKNDQSKLLITSAASQLNAVAASLAALKGEIIRLSKELPEYPIVRDMYGIGDITAAQLMGEIGDVLRFQRRSSLVAFAGVDPQPNQSGTHNPKSFSMSKSGSAHLRKTLFQIVSTYLKCKPADEAVYQFIDKKRAEGKPYYVYMTAGANKFLRIYYGRVKEYLVSLNTPSAAADALSSELLD